MNLFIFFWIRSHFGSYFRAWQIEGQRMQIMNKSFFNLQNKMIVYTIAHLLTLGIIFYFFGLFAMIAFVIAAIFGILLLETVNYIEHYGLLKK